MLELRGRLVINSVSNASRLSEILIGRPRLHEVFGKDAPPPHQNLPPDVELEVAAKSPFTAWEYANRTRKHHPTLLKSVTGSVYEPLYRREHGLEQTDKFYDTSRPAQPAAPQPPPEPEQKSGFTDFFRKLRGK